MLKNRLKQVTWETYLEWKWFLLPLKMIIFLKTLFPSIFEMIQNISDNLCTLCKNEQLIPIYYQKQSRPDKLKGNCAFKISKDIKVTFLRTPRLQLFSTNTSLYLAKYSKFTGSAELMERPTLGLSELARKRLWCHWYTNGSLLRTMWKPLRIYFWSPWQASCNENEGCKTQIRKFRYQTGK